jgi:hypothetical protein
MLIKILPSPFEGVPRESEPSTNSYASRQHLIVNGNKIRVTMLEESDSTIERYRLPSGTIENYFEKSGKKESYTIEGQGGWPRYAYTSDSKGIRYTKQEHNGAAELVVGPSQFIAGLNSVVGPYDPAYVSKLQLALNERKANSKDAFAITVSNDKPTRVQITTDGKALMIEERSWGDDPKVVAAFLKGDKVVPDKLPSFGNLSKSMRWAGNDWDNGLTSILEKTMPKEDIAALRQSMKSGLVQLEVSETTGDVVCRAIVGKPKNGNSDACKATR